MVGLKACAIYTLSLKVCAINILNLTSENTNCNRLASFIKQELYIVRLCLEIILN